MVDFDLTDEQRLMQKTAHEFAEREMRPLALEYDRKGTVPWEVIRKAHALSLDTAFIPEAYGGGGIDSTLTHVIVTEELNWGCAGMATGLIGAGLAYLPIIHMGTEDQKKRLLTRFTGPEARLGALCLTEPDAGSDVANISTTATKDGKQWVLNGVKRFITNGGVADIPLVFANRGQYLRLPDREEAGDRLHAGRHEDEGRRGPTPDLAGGLDERPRPPDEQGGEHGETVRRGHGDGSHHGRRPDPRRRRLHEGRARGEVDAGRENFSDLGRDIPDPTRRHLARGDRRALGLSSDGFDFFGRLKERAKELPFLANQVEVLVELLVAHHQELGHVVDALFHEEVDVLKARDRLRPALFLADLVHPLLQLDEA